MIPENCIFFCPRYAHAGLEQIFQPYLTFNLNKLTEQCNILLAILNKISKLYEIPG